VCSRFGARAAMFVPGGQSSYRPRTVHAEPFGLGFFVFVTSSRASSFRSVWPTVSGQKGFGGPSAQRLQTVRLVRVALEQSACRVRTVRVSGCAAGGPVAFNRPSARGSRTVRPRVADCPPCPRGPSSPGARTVRQGFRRTAKSFAS
jgi:hypothetical protein